MPNLPAAYPVETLPPEEEQLPPATPASGIAYAEGMEPTAETPVEEAAPGPFTSAVQNVQSGLGEAVAPLVEQLPQPAQNLADIVGQPVGGALDAATAVTTELGQGDLPGAVGAALQVPASIQSRGREQAGERVAEGLPVAPQNEFLDDPGSALAILPSLVLGTGLAAGGGQGIDEWWTTVPPDEQAALRDAGGNAVVDAYLSSLDASPIPPPQLVNPFDAGAIDANPIERALAIGGNIDDFLGGWATAQREGALGPFVKNLAIETAMDPLALVPPALGARVSGAGGRLARGAVRRIPGGAHLLETAPAEVARLRAEQVGTALGEYIPARRARDDIGAASAAAPTPGALTPAPNGRLAPTPDLGQAAAAAPPIPDPYDRLIHDQALGRVTPEAAVDRMLIRERTGGMGFENVHLDPNAPLRPRSPLTGRPIIPPGSRPDIEEPMRAHLDSLGLRDVGITLVNDMRDAAPDARPTDQVRFIPETNSIALSLDTTRAAEWPALIERAAQQAIREQTQRQAAQAAYGAAPAAAQQAVAETPQPRITKSGTVVSDPAARDLKLPGNEVFKFADNTRPAKGLDVEDVFEQTLRDVEYWANADDVTSKRFLALDKKFNPDGTFDRESLRGPVGDMAARERREAHAFAVLEDASQRALPRNAPKGRLGRFNQYYLGTVRRAMLFNPFNIARYTLQNLIGNSINLGLRAGPGAVLDLWTKPANIARTFRSARAAGAGKATYHTHTGSMIAAMKVGTKPNIPMSHASYFDRLGGKMPKWLERVQRALAPDTLKAIGTMADQLPRETVAERVIQREYRRLNREMPAKIYKELNDRGIFIPKEKQYQVWRDFADAHRTLTDLNTDAPYRTMLGREAKYEPVWAADDLGKHLKAHLTEDMRDPPDSVTLARAIDRVVRDSKNRHRGILDTAEAEVDHALFSWRNTNADEMASKLFLFHYWMSRQGGLYVTEGLKRPYLMSAYGRMMEEFEQQAEELNQPPYMKGFFQFQNSVAGYSTWFNPFDLVQSLLTFADWQLGMEDAEYKDLTKLGTGLGMAPFLIHPALATVAYELGLLGPDYYAPMLTGTETYGANAINLLNLANAKGLLPDWVNKAGIGVDANGNKVPLNPRPLQELYARVGNAISSAMAPITGLSPVEVANFGASRERNIASFVETEYRKAHPEALQSEVNAAVTEILADHGSPEYQAAFRKDADMPYQVTEGMPGLLAGAARIASPFRVYNWPEQYNVDRWGLTPSGDAPPRNIPGLGPGASEAEAERATDVYNAAKYGATATPEARRLADLQTAYDAIEPIDYAEANDLSWNIYYQRLTEPVTVGGQEYTPDDLAAMDDDTRYALGTQALADAGYSREQQAEYKQAQANFLGEHPDLAGLHAYRDLINAHPGGVEGFVAETAMTNPGYAQFVRSSMVDHTTGAIDYDHAYYTDAYLASQGTRPSVYSPLVGNEPSRVPGGYPELAGLESGTPLLPQVTGTAPFPLYSKPTDVDSYYANENLMAWIDPQLAGQMQTVSGPDAKYGMVQVQVGDQVGYVDPAYLENTGPPQPTAMPGPAPAAIQPTGGLAGLAGGVVSALGGVKDAVTSAVGGVINSPPQPEPKLAAPAPAGGPVAVEDTKYGLSPWAKDGAPAELVNTVVPDGAGSVGWDFRDPVDDFYYGNYFTAATGGRGNEHPGIDIFGTAGVSDVATPVGGTVVCTASDSGESGVNGFGCAAFPDTGGGVGKIEVQIAPNQSLIFGHMRTADVAYGQELTAGAVLGKMGEMNGEHVHLEARLWNPDGSYTIVDPVLLLGGYYDS